MIIQTMFWIRIPCQCDPDPGFVQQDVLDPDPLSLLGISSHRRLVCPPEPATQFSQ